MPSRPSAHAPFAFLFWVSSCAPHADESTSARAEAVVGGVAAEPGDEATVFVRAASRLCSGTLVAPNLLVTAAHCISAARDGSFRCSASGELEQDGSGVGELGAPIEPAKIAIHVGSTPAEEPAALGLSVISTHTLSKCRDDLAFVVLDRSLDDSPTRPIRLGSRVRVGEMLTVVGYGDTGVSDRWELHRREGVAVVDVGIPPRAFAVGPGPCSGDSGGPALSLEGGITGVYSLLNGECTSRVVRNTYVELAPYADLVFEAFDAAGAAPNLEPEAEPSADGAPKTSGAAGCTLSAHGVMRAPGPAWPAWLAVAALLQRRTRRRSARRLSAKRAVALALVSGLSWPLPAHADPSRETAAEHFDRALSFVDQRDFALAIAEFERAYELGRHFSVLYNLGLAYAAVGRYRDARDALTNYLRDGAAAVREDRRREVSSLVAAYEKNLVRLRIVTVPSSAEVLVDAEPPEDRARVEVDPGRHVITARAVGYTETTASVEVRAAEERSVTLELSPASPPATVAVVPERMPPQASERPSPGPDGALGGQRTAALVLGGTSVVALAVGAGFGVAANALYQDSVAHCPSDQCDPEGFERRHSAFDRAAVATVAFSVGAAAAAGALVLWFTAPRASATRVGVGADGTARGFRLRLEQRF